MMRFAIGAVLAVMCVVLRIKAIAIFSQMMDQVNQLMPVTDKIPEFGLSFLRGRVIKLHRQMYPQSPLRRALYRYWTACILAGTLALAVVVQIQPRKP